MEEDLVTLAKEHALQGFKKNEEMLSKISALDEPLNNLYWTRRPDAQDYDNRRDLVRIFNAIAREIYGENGNNCPVVEEFGSFLMDMFDVKSDLDLSINFASKRAGSRYTGKVKHLRKFAAKLYALQERKLVRNVQPILTAKVPVLKVTDCGTGIECDLSVKNMDGIAKSRFILMISAIDDRFQKICFLMKAWAKTHNINSSKDGTLNSISLILLAAFHLQTREPPILPPFSQIFKDGTQPEAVKKNISSFSNYGKENKQSLAELFVSLLIVLESVENLWAKGLCASTYDGSWICKSFKGQKGYIHIEDFTDRSEDTARAVKSNKKMNTIYSFIRQSLQWIQFYISGELDVVKLKNWLFGRDLLAGKKGITKVKSQVLQNPVLKEPSERKRKRPTMGSSKQGQGGLKKPDDSILHPAETSQKQPAGVDKSWEIPSVIHAHSSHPNLFGQIPTGFRPERPVHTRTIMEGQRGLEKPDESSRHPLTSSQTRPAGVVRSWGSSTHLSYPNVFSQFPTGFRPERPPHAWGSMEWQRGIDRLDDRSLHPSTTYQNRLAGVDKSWETHSVTHAHSHPNPSGQVPTGSWETRIVNHAHSHPNPFGQVPTGSWETHNVNHAHSHPNPSGQGPTGSWETRSVNHAHSHPNPLCQVPTEFRPERSVHTWRYGDPNFPKPVPCPQPQPYVPSSQYAPPLGFESSHQPSPFQPSSFPGGFHASDYRNCTAPLVYNRPVNAPCGPQSSSRC